MVTGLPKVGERPKPGFLGMVFYPAVSTNDHNTLDGTLRIDDVDWPRGKLDLTIVYVDRKTSNAMLRWKYSGDLMYLESFIGGYVDADGSGKRTSVEFRIPKYTSVVDVPIRLTGLRAAPLREWDDLVSSLDSADRVTWERIKSEPTNRPNFETANEDVKTAFPDWKAIDSGKRIMTAEEETRMNRLLKDGFVRAVERWLATTGFSAPAKVKILTYIRERTPPLG